MNIYTYLKSRLSRLLTIGLTALVLSSSVSFNLEAATTGGFNTEYAAGAGVVANLALFGVADLWFRQDRTPLKDPRGQVIGNQAVPRPPAKKVALLMYLGMKTGAFFWLGSNLWSDYFDDQRSGLNASLWSTALAAYYIAGTGFAVD